MFVSLKSQHILVFNWSFYNKALMCVTICKFQAFEWGIFSFCDAKLWRFAHLHGRWLYNLNWSRINVGMWKIIL